MKSKKLKNGYLECVSITTESGRTGGLISHFSSSGDDQYRFVDFFWSFDGDRFECLVNIDDFNYPAFMDRWLLDVSFVTVVKWGSYTV